MHPIKMIMKILKFLYRELGGTVADWSAAAQGWIIDKCDHEWQIDGYCEELDAYGGQCKKCGVITLTPSDNENIRWNITI